MRGRFVDREEELEYLVRLYSLVIIHRAPIIILP